MFRLKIFKDPRIKLKNITQTEESKLAPEENALIGAISANRGDGVLAVFDTYPNLYSHPLSDGGTPLHWAIRAGSYEVVTAILSSVRKEVTDKWVNAVDQYGDTVLSLAARGSNHEILVRLIAEKALKVDVRFAKEKTVLHILAKYFPVVEKHVILSLISRGVSVNATNAQGNTALHVCCAEGYANMADLLISCGAITNIKNKKGETPLICAAKNGHTKVVQVLMKGGASPFIEGVKGTAYDMAPEKNSEMKNLLQRPIVPKIITHKTPHKNSHKKHIQSLSTQKEESEESGQSTSPTLKMPVEDMMIRKSGMKSFHAVSHRLMLKGLGETAGEFVSESDPSLQKEKDKLMYEIVEELSNLFDVEWIQEVLRQVTTSVLFRWNEDYYANKIELLKWISEFIYGRKLQKYLGYLQTNYGNDIHIIVEEQLQNHENPTHGLYTQQRTLALPKLIPNSEDTGVNVIVTPPSTQSESESSPTPSLETLPTVAEHSKQKRTKSGKSKHKQRKNRTESGLDLDRKLLDDKSDNKTKRTISTVSVRVTKKDGSTSQWGRSTSHETIMKKAGRSAPYHTKHYVLVDRKLTEFPWEISFGDLYFGKKIGKGGFGNVHEGTWKDKSVAIKKLHYDSTIDDETIINFLREISILSKLNHTNIVGFSGACLGRTICLVTEYCPNGDLGTFLKSSQPPWTSKVKYSTEVACGMNYLHTQKPPIVHRDLKCSNVLVTSSEEMKLSDFGLSHHLLTSPKCSSEIGTIAWAAPEILLRCEVYTTKADVYSYGMLLWEIINDGKSPYPDKKEIELVRCIELGEKPSIPESTDPKFKTLICSCWAADKEQRPSFQQILNILKDIN